MKRWFITGTDTGIGKTEASCALLRHLAGLGFRAAGMKPVASGCSRTPDGLRNEDALALLQAANVELGYDRVNPYAFEPPIAPHLAARAAGVEIDPERIARIAAGIEADWLLVEGVGGWCVPLGQERMLADLVRVLDCEVVLVVGLRLGCINHALLSARQIIADGFALAGWVANAIDPAMQVRNDNLQALAERLPAPLLGVIPWRGDQAATWRVDWTLDLQGFRP